jgi:hypothetical protein
MRELLGFKTFDGIIDESYDLEPNTIKRFEMAFEQMEWLANKIIRTSSCEQML